MYKLSNAAADDIEAVFSFSMAEFGLRQTEIYYQGLTQCLNLLGSNPDMGSVADDIRIGYRRFAYQSHMIFYTRQVEGILVVRVLHKRMNAELHIRD